MSPTLIAAVVTILLAAAFYTFAVFAEHRAGILKRWHLALFWIGFVSDTTSTTLMSAVAGGWRPNLHGLLGVGSILLMLVHCIWATVAIVQDKKSVLERFHRFSLAVWALWMVTLVTGFGLAIPEILAKKAAAGAAASPAASSLPSM
jgi:uncharacterized repeat protein (TIGR03987 family)